MTEHASYGVCYDEVAQLYAIESHDLGLRQNTMKAAASYIALKTDTLSDYHERRWHNA